MQPERTNIGYLFVKDGKVWQEGRFVDLPFELSLPRIDTSSGREQAIRGEFHEIDTPIVMETDIKQAIAQYFGVVLNSHSDKVFDLSMDIYQVWLAHDTPRAAHSKVAHCREFALEKKLSSADLLYKGVYHFIEGKHEVQADGEYDFFVVGGDAEVTIKGYNSKGGYYVWCAQKAVVTLLGGRCVLLATSGESQAKVTDDCDSAHIQAFGESIIQASSNCTVEAYHRASIIAKGNCFVRTWLGEPNIQAYDNAEVWCLGGGASVKAYEHCTIRIRSPKISVDASDNCLIDAEQDPIIFARGQTVVRIKDGSGLINLFDQATAIAYPVRNHLGEIHTELLSVTRNSSEASFLDKRSKAKRGKRKHKR